MVIALAALLVCLSMLLIYVFVRTEERHLERPKAQGQPVGRRSTNNRIRNAQNVTHLPKRHSNLAGSFGRGFRNARGIISAVMELEPCSRLSSLLDRYAFPPPILNVEEPIAFGTAELKRWAALGVRNHLPH